MDAVALPAGGEYAAPAPTPIRPDAVLPPGLALPDPYPPRYPAWLYETDPETGVRELSPPSEPREDQCKDWVTNDALLYADRQRQFAEDLRLYRQMTTGVAKGFDPDADSAFWDAEATVQVNKVAAMVAEAPVRIQYPWRTLAEREAAADMEAFARWFIETWKSYHRRLQWDMGWYALIYGRVVTQVSCDLDDGDYPWWVDLHDPATCFPIYGRGKHGMLRMSRRFVAATGDLLDEFDPTGEEGLARKLGEQKGGRGKKANGELDWTADRTVEQVYTRWHRWTAVDGITVDLTAHEYGVVPFVENLAPGEASTASAPDTPGDPSLEKLSRADIKRGAGGQSSTSRQRDVARKGQSFFHAIRGQLRQREKVLGLHMTALEQAVNPAMVEITANPKGMAPTDLSPGTRNQNRPGEQRNPAIPAPRPFDASTILAQLNAEIAKGLLPDVIFGQTEGSNITGFASDSLIAAAKDRIGPYFGCVQDTVADTIHLATLLFYNHGHLAEGLADGALVIPRTNRGAGFAGGVKPADTPPWAQGIVAKVVQAVAGPPTPAGMPQPGGSPLVGMPGFVDPAWTLPALPPADAPLVTIDRAKIDLVAARPRVSLDTLGLNNRTVLINYLTSAVREKLMPRAVAMDQLPENEDALAAWQQILAEDAQTDPDILRLIGYPRALAQQGDVEGFLTYWATILLPQIVQSLTGGLPPGQGQPPPGQAPGPPPGNEPPQGGGGEPPFIEQPTPQNAASGVNPAAIGRGPGSQGAPVGRPG